MWISYFVGLVLWLLLCQELPLGVGNLAACEHTGEKMQNNVHQLVCDSQVISYTWLDILVHVSEAKEQQKTDKLNKRLVWVVLGLTQRLARAPPKSKGPAWPAQM